jgi:hypothetical protein
VELGPYWGVVIGLATLEGILALILLATYAPIALRKKRGIAILLALIPLGFLAHSVLTVMASISMASKGLGEEAAGPMIPVNAVAAFTAAVLLAIARK